MAWRGEIQKLGEDYDAIEEIPADLRRERRGVPRPSCSRPSPRPTRRLLEKYLGGEELTVEQIKARASAS